MILTLSHPLDYIRWLLGQVSSLWAFTARLGDLQLDVEDSAEIGLRFVSGALGSVHLDYVQRPPAQRLEIIGSQGTIQWESADGSARLFRAGRGEWEVFPPPEGFERNTLFLEQMRHFLDVARGQAQPLCTLQDGIEALRLALAAHASQAQGQLITL